jgi:hypothetical protein
MRHPAHPTSFFLPNFPSVVLMLVLVENVAKRTVRKVGSNKGLSFGSYRYGHPNGL